jgi:hypothetical protein
MSFEKDNYHIVKKVLSDEVCDLLRNVAFDTRETHIKQKKCNVDIHSPGSFVILNDHITKVISEKIKPIVEKVVGNELVSMKSKVNIYGRRDDVKKNYEYDGNSKYIVSILIGFNYNDSNYRWPIYLIDEFNKHELTQDVGDALVYKNDGQFKYNRDPLMKPPESYHIQLYLNYVDDNEYF